MDNTTYMVLLAEVTGNLKQIIAADHAMQGQLLNDALKLLGKINTQSRKLARESKALKVVAKSAK